MIHSLPSYLEKQGYTYRLEKAKAASLNQVVQLSITDKRGQLVPYIPNAVQQHFRAHRTRRDLVLKARQVGISTEIQAQQFMTAIRQPSLQATLAHDDETTQKLRRMTDRYWRNLPDHLRPKRGLDNDTTTTYPATGSEVTIVTAGSKNKGRGGTLTHVHGSEVAFWKNAEDIMAGVLQGVSDEGYIVLESTPSGAQGWFYNECMQALDGDPAWRLHFYPWWWDAGYRVELSTEEAAHIVATLDEEEMALVTRHNLTPDRIAWRRRKQRQLGMKFPQEYPEDPRACFLLSGGGFFTDALTDVFIAPYLDAPMDVHRHVAGLDFGQTTDYTVCRVLDQETFEERAILRINRLPWNEQRRRIIEFCQQWDVRLLVPERNAMGPNIEALQAELPDSISMMPFMTDTKSKPAMIGALRVALAEEGLKLLDDPTSRRELQAFKAWQSPSGHWQYGAPDGEHDDTVIALALAVHGIRAGLAVGATFLDLDW